jgi:catechol 2,3-dioxygenase-like lactoylglutathione lyase family enzyme
MLWPMKPLRVLESVLYAEDLVAARAFYVGVLELEEVSFDPERDLFLRCEGAMLILFKASKTLVDDAGVPTHGTTGPGHLAFAATEKEMRRWEARLLFAGAPDVRWKEWGNGAKSLYFRDPAGNSLEFAMPELWGLPS